MPKVMWALWVSWCNLVPQLPRVVTFACDLRFRRVIARWKGISDLYTFRCQTLTPSTFLLWQVKKPTFRALKQPWKYNRDVLT
jgi:hypothetical protein